MARKRMINPMLWDDPDLIELSRDERLLFIGLVSFADDYGHVAAHPALLRKWVFGYDDLTVGQVREMSDNIIRKCRNVELYVIDGQEYLWLKTWERHQDLRYRAKGQYPCHCCGRYHVQDADSPDDYRKCPGGPGYVVTTPETPATPDETIAQPLRTSTQELRKNSGPDHVTLDHVESDQITLDQGSSALTAPSRPPKANGKKKPVVVFSDEEEGGRLCELLRTLMLTNNPTSKVRKLTEGQAREWYCEMERLIRIDGRDPPEVEAMIRWSQGDEFWRRPIQSPASLRRNWDKMYLDFKAPPPDRSSKEGNNGRTKRDSIDDIDYEAKYGRD